MPVLKVLTVLSTVGSADDGRVDALGAGDNELVGLALRVCAGRLAGGAAGVGLAEEHLGHVGRGQGGRAGDHEGVEVKPHL